VSQRFGVNGHSPVEELAARKLTLRGPQLAPPPTLG